MHNDKSQKPGFKSFATALIGPEGVRMRQDTNLTPSERNAMDQLWSDLIRARERSSDQGRAPGQKS